MRIRRIKGSREDIPDSIKQQKKCIIMKEKYSESEFETINNMNDILEALE